MNSANESGFTLVELLVSIIIVSLLAAIGIPQYQGYKGRVYDTQSLAIMRDLQNAVEAIADQVERGEVRDGAPDYAYQKKPGLAGEDIGDLDVTTTTDARMSDYINIENDRIFALGGSADDQSGDLPIRIYYIFHCEGTKFFQFLEWKRYNQTTQSFFYVQTYLQLELTEFTRNVYGC